MNRRSLDVVLLWAVLCLVGLGVVMVYSASSVNAAAKLGDPDFYLKRQGAFAALGVVALFIGSALPVKFWHDVALPALGIAFLSLILVKIPGLGRVGGGAQRWLQIGPLGFQPSELCKFALLNFLAYSLYKQRDQIRTLKYGFLPHVLVPGAMGALLMLQPDFGTTVVLLLLAGLLMILGGVRLRYLLVSLGAGVPLAVIAVMRSDYRMKRILAFLDPWAHRQDIGYQVAESLISFGSGGLAGQGLGAGKQKLFFLPAAHTDFIFAIIGEELGLVGVMLTVGLFGLIAWRGMRAFRRLGPTPQGYLCAGLTSLIVLQAATNMAVVMGLLPTKGLTLPFVSYGGSSLIAFCFMAGVLLRLSGDSLEHEVSRPTFTVGVLRPLGVRA
ncbi:MAG: putative lipid II flippase FtsW [Deltaproteobacteria bacterium]|nr:putative lipid II flippase FtsW [Deltaproteobacteria bacterium]